MKSKDELYVENRIHILNKLFIILNINENNNTFFLADLDRDIDKQNEILELVVDIKKYFACSKWPCFYDCNIKRKVLSIIKNVIKKMNYHIISKRKFRKNVDIVYRDTIYYLIKNNSI